MKRAVFAALERWPAVSQQCPLKSSRMVLQRLRAGGLQSPAQWENSLVFIPNSLANFGVRL